MNPQCSPFACPSAASSARAPASALTTRHFLRATALGLIGVWISFLLFIFVSGFILKTIIPKEGLNLLRLALGNVPFPVANAKAPGSSWVLPYSILGIFVALLLPAELCAEEGPDWALHVSAAVLGVQEALPVRSETMAQITATPELEPSLFEHPQGGASDRP